ncbi:MAG: DNA-processing protein DprA [Oscillospiraceae bacterium]|jgi:DNA processing protein|nr:DNA-processing protein DprA [Oscillospiraceae bacterium]
MSTLKYYVWLASRKGVGAASAGRALRHFGSAENVFFATSNELKKIPEIRPDEHKALNDKDLSEPSDILAECAKLGHRVVTIQDAEYPERLRNIYDPPIVLYVKGRLPAIDEEAVIGVVGTRSCTPYGLKQAEACGYELARRGLIVATGLAKGVDNAAALGALRGGGAVIGLLGCGIDVIYPPNAAQLYEDVAAVGALISEYPPGTSAVGSNFPVRNRILSGISVGVAVVEAPLRSGALITASRALEQGRDVFAMPGNVDSDASAGANALLRDGAIPMTTAADIVAEYAELFPLKIKSGAMRKVPLDKKLEKRLIAAAAEKPQQSSIEKTVDKPPVKDYIVTGTEKVVYDALRSLLNKSGEPQAHLDDVIVASALDAADAMGAMTMLEIDGIVDSHGGGYYSLAE